MLKNDLKFYLVVVWVVLKLFICEKLRRLLKMKLRIKIMKI